jgi:hypothetical protein
MGPWRGCLLATSTSRPMLTRVPRRAGLHPTRLRAISASTSLWTHGVGLSSPLHRSMPTRRASRLVSPLSCPFALRFTRPVGSGAPVVAKVQQRHGGADFFGHKRRRTQSTAIAIHGDRCGTSHAVAQNSERLLLVKLGWFLCSGSVSPDGQCSVRGVESLPAGCVRVAGGLRARFRRGLDEEMSREHREIRT